MMRNGRNTYNHSYRNQPNLRSNSSLSQKRNYNTFQEDPRKAVFLSGFRTNIPEDEWKGYREAIYQDLRKYVYIRKLDLPVNHRFGYLHTKTVEQAEYLLNLKNVRDEETGKSLSQLDLARNTKSNWRTKVYVYEYERKNEGDHLGSRNHSCERNLNVRGRSERSFNNSGYDSPQSQDRSCKNFPGTRSRNDNSLSTNGFMSEDFSRSISPYDNENQPNNTNINTNTNTNTNNNDQLAPYQKTSNFNQTINKDSALPSNNITEPGSEDENMENVETLLLKNCSKINSTKTVVPVDKNVESMNYTYGIEIESDAELNLSSDDGDKMLKPEASTNQNQVNFQQVAEQTKNKIIHESLKQNWLELYNCLTSHVQQQLMQNYIEACWAQGVDYAAQQLTFQGCLAVYLQVQGIPTL